MLTCDDLMLLGPLSDPGMKVVQTRWERKQSCVDMCKEDKANLIEADGDLWTEYNTNGLTVNQAIGNMRLLNHKRFKKTLNVKFGFYVSWIGTETKQPLWVSHMHSMSTICTRILSIFIIFQPPPVIRGTIYSVTAECCGVSW